MLPSLINFKSFILRGLVISAMAIFFTFLDIFILHLTDDQPCLAVLFEVVSVFGTVALSIGVQVR